MGARVLSVFFLLGLAAGCGDDATTGPAADTGRERVAAEEREAEVAGDEDATPGEIIEAGSAVDVAAVGTRTVITYRVQSVGDDGPRQVAWRMYDPAGRRVAEGRLHGDTSDTRVQPAGDVFLLAGLRVDLGGEATPVPEPTEPSPVRPGDVLLDTGFEGARILYRSGDSGERGTFWQLPPVPGENPQGIRVGADGSVWVAQASPRPGRAPVSWSADGQAPWRTEQVPVGARSHPLGTSLTVIGTRVFLFTSSSGTAESAPIDGLFERSTRRNGTWHRIALDGAPIGRTLSPGIQALPDGRLVIHDDRTPAYVQDGEGWRPLRIPSEFALGLRVVGDVLYVDHHPRRPLSVSHDEGRTWTEVPR